MVSGAEVAFFSLGPVDIDDIEGRKGKSSKMVTTLLDKPKDLLAIILIANNFINVSIIIIATFLSNEIFPEGTISPSSKFLIDVVVITFFLLLFGEVIPKIYATKQSLKLSLIMALPLYYLGRVFPFSILKNGLVKGTSVLSKIGRKKALNISSDELEEALKLTKDETFDDHKILEGIVKFGNKDVKQIMKPRLDVDAVEYSLDFHGLYSELLESNYSRLPVYADSFDKIEGVLVLKDLLPYLDETAEFKWQELIREPYFVPENKKIDDLLNSFQEMKMHMAIVVDEYGGTSGIVTLEDVLEEIVGDISDEFDEDELTYSKLDDHNYVFEGKTPLIDVYKVLEIQGEEFEEAKSESDTIAGFVIEQAGKILKKNEKITFKNYDFTVESADSRKVKRIKLTIKSNEEDK